jgi:serine acetyltransferase
MRLPGLAVGILYRLIVEWGLGIEIPWKTSLGAGVKLYHGVGLVVNDRSVIEAGVTLRNGVTIGHVRPGEGCPVIRRGVELGANCVILGPVEVGADSIIGAGAVVTKSIPARSLAVGVPARVIRGL